MREITNPKIKKKKDEIEKTKAKIAEYQSKQREQEKQLRMLEDLEIVARFRSERLSDEHLSDLKSPDTNVIPSNNPKEDANSEIITANQ